MLDKLKAWVWPLGRTFLAVFLTALLAGLATIDFGEFKFADVDLLGSIAFGAIGTAVNAVVIAAQRAIPGVPNPEPPAA